MMAGKWCFIALALSTAAAAQTYPTKPVRIVVNFAPGGGTDRVARAMAPEFTRTLGQQVTAHTLGLDGSESFDITGLSGAVQPRQQVTLLITRRDGTRQEVPLTLRLDTPAEVEYVRNGGIMPYVLAGLAAQSSARREVVSAK